MRLFRRQLTLMLLVVGGALGAGCAPDGVEPNGFVRTDAAAPGAPPAADASPPPGPSPPLPPSPSPSPSPDAGSPADPACNLAGRWLVAQRVMAVAIGQQQVAHNWFYYEIQQAGSEVTVSRGLHCGFEVVKKTALAASVDSSAAWPALLAKNSSAGRRGQFVKEGAGCRLKLAREYTVRGATLPHYADPSVPMPGRADKAEGGKPGWEDWDADGQPGISLKVTSALASGTLYTCQRDWTEWDGSTTAGANKLKVAIRYGGEQVALGRSPGSAQAIESSSTASSSPDEHYVYLHRLADGQAAGAPEAICAAVRELRAQLVPEAGQ
jgi:hypothetical protein